jgi:outer membrane protein assembly factor BamB
VYLGYNGMAALDPNGNVLWQTEEQKISVVMIPWAVGEAGYLYVRNGDPHHYVFDLEGNLIWEDDQTERVDNMFRAAVAKDGTLYLFRGGYLRAVKPTEGEVWRIAMTHAVPQVLASGNILTEYQGVASCYSPGGKLIWEYDIIKQSQSNRGGNASQYTSTSCLASGHGVIYFSRFCGALHCLDEDGNELWRRQAAVGRFGGFSFLKLGPGGNVYCTENGKALCLDPAGKEIWKVDVTPMTDIWQITSDRHVLLEDHNFGVLPGRDKKRFTMLDPAGKQLWTIVEDGSFPGPHPCDGGTALIVRAYDANGARVWPHDEPASVTLELVR